jgi:predicted dehydrogenase
LRVGVIGAGAIARRAHLPALASIKDIELIGIADKVNRRAERLARRFNIKKAYSDYLQLLDEGLDFAVLCTPSNLHGSMIADCAVRGVNVLTEKPLAHDFEAGLAALKVAKEKGVKVCVVQNYRHCPVVRQAKEIVDSGRLGTVLTMIIVAHTPSPMQWTHSNWLYRAGGALDDFGPHAYDLMAWFANSNPEIVYAWGADATQGMNLVNYAHISVGFANRVHAATDLSWFSGSRKFSIDIHGTGGRLHVDVTTDSLEEIHGFATPISDLMNSWSRTMHTVREAAFGRLLMGGIAYYDRLYDDFLQFLRNSGPVPVSPLDSLRAVQIMDYSRRSVSEKKSIIVPMIEEELTH